MTLDNLIKLSSNIKIYIPSTINVDKDFDNSELVDKTLKMFSDIFGGSTAYQALGCYTSHSGELIKEKVTICESYTDTDTLGKNIEQIIDFAQTIKTGLRQESVALEVNNVLYLV